MNLISGPPEGVSRCLPSSWTMHIRINQALNWQPLTNDQRPLTR
jgi:hypothetical protein